VSAPGLQGLRPWIIQRITAVYIALYVIYFAAVLFASPPLLATEWRSWMTWPANTIATGLFIIALLWHTWIGIRDVVLDYVPNVVARMLLLTLVVSVLLGSGLWMMKALLLVLVK
jgi:succinate dehydrogenase / fumarate reductase membrane anchor subunit